MPKSEDSEDLDLLGMPVQEPEEMRGRPSFEVTAELRSRVSVLRAGGMEYAEIAAAIGCSERTLRTYFLPELKAGAASKKAELIAAMFAAGMSGNVTAQKAFIALGEKADAMPPLPIARKPIEEKPEKLGKKEAADRDALRAHEGDPEWADLLH